MYGVPSPAALGDRANFMKRAFEAPDLRKGLEKLGVEKLDNPSMGEEQEREVNHEVEREQQTQRPPKRQPASPLIHPDVKNLLHIYAPRISLAMLSFSNLRFYSIPAPPVDSATISVTQLQLDLFAGQLYLSSYQNYVSLCSSLGIFVPSGGEGDLQIEIDSDGFVKPENQGQLIQSRSEYHDCWFATTPIPALMDLVGRRRKGMRYLLTHVGQILHSRSLTSEDF